MHFITCRYLRGKRYARHWSAMQKLSLVTVVPLCWSVLALIYKAEVVAIYCGSALLGCLGIGQQCRSCPYLALLGCLGIGLQGRSCHCLQQLCSVRLSWLWSAMQKLSLLAVVPLCWAVLPLVCNAEVIAIYRSPVLLGCHGTCLQCRSCRYLR